VGKIIPLEIRFWNHVVKTDTCWNWVGATIKSGYGKLRVDKRTCLAHRVSYSLKYGGIPRGLYILHNCDNPRCVNPEHLFAGSQKENVADMISKGRDANLKRVVCAKGHQFTVENTREVFNPHYHRRCRICERMAQRKYRGVKTPRVGA